MWKWYFLALMLTARLLLHCCQGSKSAFTQSRGMSARKSVCPPRLPLIDFIDLWEKSPYAVDFDPLKSWTGEFAANNPALFGIIALLGVLEHIAENAMLLWLFVFTVKKILEIVSSTLHWIMTFAVVFALLAYALKSQEEIVTWVRRASTLLSFYLDR